MHLIGFHDVMLYFFYTLAVFNHLTITIMKAHLNATWNRGDDEVKLFRKMSDILKSAYNVTFVEEVHRKYVDFLSSTISGNVRREIADLWIISYSPIQGRAKMTFLQAKYHRGQLARPGVFKAEFFQYELLSERPLLTSGGTPNFPLDILKSSCCDSVGSYGVFYQDNNNQIDLAYSSARLLSNTSSVPTAYTRSTIELQFSATAAAYQNCSCNSCQELNYTYSIDDFTTSVLNLEIGADLEYFSHIMRYINSVLASLAPSPAVTGFISFIADNDRGIPGRDGTDGGEGGADNDGYKGDGLPCSLLIINVDIDEDKR